MLAGLKLFITISLLHLRSTEKLETTSNLIFDIFKLTKYRSYAENDEEHLINCRKLNCTKKIPLMNQKIESYKVLMENINSRIGWGFFMVFGANLQGNAESNYRNILSIDGWNSYGEPQVLFSISMYEVKGKEEAKSSFGFLILHYYGGAVCKEYITLKTEIPTSSFYQLSFMFLQDHDDIKTIIKVVIDESKPELVVVPFYFDPIGYINTWLTVGARVLDGLSATDCSLEQHYCFNGVIESPMIIFTPELMKIATKIFKPNILALSRVPLRRNIDIFNHETINYLVELEKKYMVVSKPFCLDVRDFYEGQSWISHTNSCKCKNQIILCQNVTNIPICPTKQL